MIDCLLIIVSYRSETDVADLLADVPQAIGVYSWRAVVVNNDPEGDLRPVLEHYPEAEVAEPGFNLGYAGGINYGSHRAPRSRWTVVLNPDLRLGPGSIARLVQAAGHSCAAVPTIVDERGVRQHSQRREPSILGSLGDCLFGDRWGGRPYALSEMVRTSSQYEVPGSVDWATGAILVIPSAIASRVGPWDEGRFFLYSEETDYCRRLRMAGVEIRFVPDAVVSHRGAGSGQSDALYALLEVNRVRYFRKWHGTVAASGFIVIAILNNTLRAHRSRNRAALKALVSRDARAALPGGTR